MVLQKRILEERSKRGHEALTRVKQLDDLEDKQGIEEEEEKKCKGWQDIVDREDRKLEMDWSQ